MAELSFVTGISFMLILAGLCIVLDVGWDIVRGTPTRAWRAAPGRVLRSDARTAPIHWGGRTAMSHGPSVGYEYHVSGRRYEGTRVSYGRTVPVTWAGAYRAAGRFREGRKVTVWYDPERPEHAVLLRGVSPEAWIVVAVGAVFVGFGAWLV